jgi:hypothetical protein
MKRILIFLFVAGFFLRAYPQNSSVFVLVDVSKSVSRSDLEKAKTALTDVLLGRSLSNAHVNFGSASELLACQLQQGDRLSILKFGSKATLMNNDFSLTPVRNMPGDVIQQVNSRFPTALTDDRTYLVLAKAKVAEYAKSNNISNYRLYLITDNISDDYGPNGKPDYTDYERSLAEGYNTSTNPVKEAPSIKVKLNAARNQDYVLEFIPEVDVTAYNLPNQTPPAVTDNEEFSTIRLTSYANGKRNNEVQAKSSPLSINWSCSNFPEGGKFTVIIVQYGGGKYRDVRKDLSTYSASFRVPDGKYRVTVSAQNFQAEPDTTYVDLKTGGGGWFWILFLFLLAAGAGYYYWQRKRRMKLEDEQVTGDRDIFSQNDPGSGSQDKYF